MNPCSSDTTAILIFALSSGEELRRKKFAKGQKLFKELTEHTLQTAKKTGLPYFRVAEDLQLGTSFGERFSNAIQSIFDKGFEKIITVGNDSPHLTKSHILRTVSQLESGKSVIGPSADGGFYLMGLQRSDFKKPDFEGLSWQSSIVKQEIVKLLESSGKETYLLPILYDIDSVWDVEVLSRKIYALSLGVLNAIKSIVSSNIKIEIPSFFLYDGLHLQTPFNKGSPIATFS